MIPRPSPASLFLLLAGLGAACHQSSSSPVPPIPSTSTTNLGLTFEDALGYGSLRLLNVSEARQGEDLNGDGDTLDRLAHVVDLVEGSVIDTGLDPAFPNSARDPLPVAAVDTTLAFAVAEWGTDGLDRNGDGDALDRVLAVFDRDTGTVENLGVAASSVVASADLVAFDVPEDEEGEDLDGDGDLDDSSPSVHDLGTGETWSTGLRGARVLGVDGGFVSLSVDEAVVGDRNDDGDALDLVFEVYDAGAREVQHAGLAMTRIFGPQFRPFAQGGRWAVVVSEQDQGGGDLDGDGDALDTVTLVYDPVLRSTRNLGERIVRPVRGLDRFVLVDWPAPGTPFASQLVWLYDPETDALESTGLRGAVLVLESPFLGAKLVVIVEEEHQGEDLDRNGFLDGSVPVIYDPASGRTTNLGIDGSGSVQPDEGGLLILSREDVSRRDWNGDGDRTDTVLFTWTERTGRVVNSRLAPAFATPLGEGIELLLVDEAGMDRNGDGDGVDRVVEVYDAFSGTVTDTGLATFFLFLSSSDKTLVAVFESEQGQDLNGDGDQDDRVLHLTRVLFQALRPQGG